MSYTYSWTVNGVAIPGGTDATGSAFTVPQVKRGDVIAVTVSARNAAGYVSPSVTATVTAGNSAPTVGSVTIGPASPTAGTSLTATPSGFTDVDGDALTYQYAWFENGQPIAGATGNTLPAASVVAGTVSVQVVATDGYGGTSSQATATVVVTAADSRGQSNPGGGQPNPGGGQPAPVVDQTPPTIRVTSPTATVYQVGRQLPIRFSCSDGSGVASCRATLGLVGGKAVSVRSGQTLRLTNPGHYVLRIAATDRNGNAGSRTIYFRMTRDRRAPAISILSPNAMTYRSGQMLLVRFSSTDPSGVARSTATLGRVGTKGVRVRSGEKVRLSGRGRYCLRITATDRVGNSGVRTLYFSVK